MTGSNGGTMGDINIHITQAQIDLADLNERELRIEIATHLYKIGAVSFGKAREITDLDIVGFWRELGKREIDANYSLEDFESDMRTAEKLLGQPVP